MPREQMAHKGLEYIKSVVSDIGDKFQRTISIAGYFSRTKDQVLTGCSHHARYYLAFQDGLKLPCEEVSICAFRCGF